MDYSKIYTKFYAAIIKICNNNNIFPSFEESGDKLFYLGNFIDFLFEEVVSDEQLLDFSSWGDILTPAFIKDQMESYNDILIEKKFG